MVLFWSFNRFAFDGNVFMSRYPSDTNILAIRYLIMTYRTVMYRLGIVSSIIIFTAPHIDEASFDDELYDIHIQWFPPSRKSTDLPFRDGCNKIQWEVISRHHFVTASGNPQFVKYICMTYTRFMSLSSRPETSTCFSNHAPAVEVKRRKV